jgi:hypothetical protein
MLREERCIFFENNLSNLAKKNAISLKLIFKINLEEKKLDKNNISSKIFCMRPHLFKLRKKEKNIARGRHYSNPQIFFERLKARRIQFITPPRWEGNCEICVIQFFSDNKTFENFGNNLCRKLASQTLRNRFEIKRRN